MIQTIVYDQPKVHYILISLFLVAYKFASAPRQKKKRPTFLQSEVTRVQEHAYIHKEVRELECYIPYIARIPLTSSLESTALLFKLLVDEVMMEPGTSE